MLVCQAPTNGLLLMIGWLVCNAPLSLVVYFILFPSWIVGSHILHLDQALSSLDLPSSGALNLPFQRPKIQKHIAHGAGTKSTKDGSLPKKKGSSSSIASANCLKVTENLESSLSTVDEDRPGWICRKRWKAGVIRVPTKSVRILIPALV